MKRTNKAIVLGLVAAASTLAGCSPAPPEPPEDVEAAAPAGEPEPYGSPIPREARKKGERSGRDD